MTLDDPQDWPAPTAPKPIVIIGAGGIVRDAHLPAYAKAGVTVCGVTDPDPAKAAALAAEFGIAQVFGLWPRLLLWGRGWLTMSPCRHRRSRGFCRTGPMGRRC